MDDDDPPNGNENDGDGEDEGGSNKHAKQVDGGGGLEAGTGDLV